VQSSAQQGLCLHAFNCTEYVLITPHGHTICIASFPSLAEGESHVFNLINLPLLNMMQKLHEFRFKGAMLPSDLINPIKPLEVASWLKAHPGSFPAFAVALLPDADSQSRHLSKCYQQSLAWVRWAMLGAPESVHQALSVLLDTEGQATGACGSQWGSDDIAYRY
jgi:hypothetical protein